jgi:hypothetical protein
MSEAPGIAGSTEPEQPGCFLCVDEWETDWFVEMNNTGGTVDVWAVEGIDKSDLVVSPEGYSYFPGRIPVERLSLVRWDIEPVGEDAPSDGPIVVRVSFKPRRRHEGEQADGDLRADSFGTPSCDI